MATSSVMSGRCAVKPAASAAPRKGAAPCVAPAPRVAPPSLGLPRAGPVRAHPPPAVRLAPVKALAEPPSVGDADSESAGAPRGAHWEVHKFGGTCVSAADRIRAAADLVLSSDADNSVVVCSAMGAHPSSPVKVTDLLLAMIDKAGKQDAGYLIDLAAIQEKHVQTAKELLGEGPELNGFIAQLLEDISNLKAMLQAMSIAGIVTEAFADYLVGHGELWCASLFAAYCRQQTGEAVFMDTRDVLVVKPTSDGQSVDPLYDESNANLDKWFKQAGCPKIVVATGFIAKTPEGQVTTLKRNGSDYSATIMGSLLESGSITIWTDVDGVYSADPRKVPDAVCLPSLTYHEAWELSYFGANVLHPRTTLPAMKHNIPVTLRNFFNLSAPGTRISDLHSDTIASAGMNVKGFATVDHVTLINVEGTGMVGVPGVASAIFSTIRDANINVIMISQASSEHSVCFAVADADGKHAEDVLNKRFKDAIEAGRLHQVQAIKNCCVLAAVGQQMASCKGTAATMFGALAKSNINIKAIAQGCSEYNITVLIEQADAERALRCVHGRFFLSDVPLSVGIVGVGLIGGELMAQMHEESERLHDEFNIGINVHAIANSRRMLLSETGINPDSWNEDLVAQGEPADLDRMADALLRTGAANAVIIDCTASDVPAEKYLDWIAKGIHVITPNKKLGSGPLDRYLAVRETQRNNMTHFFYEATVGAGLPIMQTLKFLVETGDKIVKIEGIFSGTMSYIFNSFGKDDTKFSEIVAGAKESGFTEPDPRDDLAGMDVARKVTILAREAGLNLELEKVPVRSLVPAELENVTVEEYMRRLSETDEDMAKLAAEADARGEALRFVGVVDMETGEGGVELKSYPKSHPFCQLQGSDNIISFQTERYFHQPLIVRGPGAGAAVTAAGVFSDLLRLAAYLGAPS